MEALEPGKPLSFLDHHIQQGNSLIGATPALLARGIPDEAFTPIEGDDKKYCAEFKKRNKQERAGQMSFALDAERPAWERLGDLATAMAHLESSPDDTPEAVRAKQAEYEALVRSAGYEFGRLWADAWCAAFVWKKTREFEYPITEARFREIERNPFNLAPWMRDEIRRLAKQYSFFHWHLAFPDVFRPQPGQPEEDDVKGWEGGFDCVLGNPPWERIKLQEEEFFAARNPEIAGAANKAARQKLIKALPETDPVLAKAFADAKREAEAASHFVRQSGRYPLTAVGDVNTYALFAELTRQLISNMGMAGIIVPTGIVTDDTTKVFFSSMVEQLTLAHVIGFENEEFIFQSVHNEFKFCLLILGGSARSFIRPSFMFFSRFFSDIHQPERWFELTANDIALLNPNSRTCPVFRTGCDAQLAKTTYSQIPVLNRGETDHGTWGVSFMRMIDMANDSALFAGVEGPGLVPLYEAKMIGQFNHRYASLIGKKHAGRRPSRKYEGWYGVVESDPFELPTPRYWVPKAAVDARLSHSSKEWLLGFRDVARATDERSAIFSILPRSAVGHNIPLVFLSAKALMAEVACFFGNCNSLALDYFARQKLGGTSLSYFILKQLPVLPPPTYSPENQRFLVPRVIELTFTAWDIKPFADDLWREAGSALRALLQRQWDENAAATGGHTWDPPAWAEIAPDGCPLPPFKWHEERRAVLRAELDAYYAKLYGLNRKQLRYILDPHGLSQRELEDILDPWEDPTCAGPHLLPEKPALDFPGETFRVLKEKEERLYGEYRTRRLVLEAWERLGTQGESGDSGA
jgi:hypothetical protein